MEPSDSDGPSPGPAVFPYASAAAFRTALRDWFAYDRVLARLFTAPDATSLVLKGAGALLARLERARHCKDIDVDFAEQSAAVSDATSEPRPSRSSTSTWWSGRR